MPKLAGVNVLGVVLAALAMWIIGYVWYGLVFGDAWLATSGYTAEMFEGQSPLWMGAGLLLSVVLSFGLGWHMNQKNISVLKTAALFGLWLSLLIGVPLMAYGYVYSPGHSLELFMINASHTVVTFVVACSVLSLFD